MNLSDQVIVLVEDAGMQLLGNIYVGQSDPWASHAKGLGLNHSVHKRCDVLNSFGLRLDGLYRVWRAPLIKFHGSVLYRTLCEAFHLSDIPCGVLIFYEFVRRCLISLLAPCQQT